MGAERLLSKYWLLKTHDCKKDGKVNLDLVAKKIVEAVNKELSQRDKKRKNKRNIVLPTDNLDFDLDRIRIDNYYSIRVWDIKEAGETAVWLDITLHKDNTGGVAEIRIPDDVKPEDLKEYFLNKTYFESDEKIYNKKQVEIILKHYPTLKGNDYLGLKSNDPNIYYVTTETIKCQIISKEIIPLT